MNAACGGSIDVSFRQGPSDGAADASHAVADAPDAFHRESDTQIAVRDASRDAVEEPPVIAIEAGRDGGIDVGAALDGQRWEVPCTGPSTESDRLCSTVPAATSGCPDVYRPVDRTATFGGEPGQRYAVTLRFRGVVGRQSSFR